MYLLFFGKLLWLELSKVYICILNSPLCHTTMYLIINTPKILDHDEKMAYVWVKSVFLAFVVFFTVGSSGDPGSHKEQCTILIFYKKGIKASYKKVCNRNSSRFTSTSIYIRIRWFACSEKGYTSIRGIVGLLVVSQQVVVGRTK